MNIETESEQVPREYYRLIADLSNQLEESEVPQRYVERVLDKVELLIAEALSHVEEESDDEGDSDDEDAEDDDGEETRKG